MTEKKIRKTYRISEQNIARMELIGVVHNATENAVVNAAIWALAIQAGIEPESDAPPVLYI